VRSGGVTCSVGGGGGEQRGGMGHMDRSGLRQLGQLREAALAAKEFGPEANENIKTLFYFIWILFKQF
jgi:hypothetical protein